MTGTGREMERDFSDGGGIGEEEGCDGGRGEIRIEERVEIEMREPGGRWWQWQWKMGGEGDGGAAIWRRRRPEAAAAAAAAGRQHAGNS